ncbi:ChrR family anti-sigma-E factor [Roseinatronobacter monicus]|uniref:ChrR-like anti-ECFsigma factor n=1 Tax=Roseinatronobacter monicus TaxID=393481 RepID=A0A543KA30_9RHOB|nr:ChrR family anti-sigma-E factor [Roseinatronobacter monicus]TQM91906.1 ChrR-like anti-ECFsigma factor [Roseinatronobacter monicus]
MINHHLSDKLLMAYSAGTLPEAFNLAVATHIAMCDECRARLASFDAVGGAVLEQVAQDSAAMDDTALSATLSRIKAKSPSERPSAKPKGAGILPEPLCSYVGGDVDAVKWRSVGGGVRQAVIPTSDRATARLLYIPAGVAVPDHGHNGMELTLVLQGAFADEADCFRRGDIEIADEGTEHQPIAQAGLDCICLAVTDAPLKFRGFLPRLAQPFLGI